MTFDPNYAPPGFMAVEGEGCCECAFKDCDSDTCDAICEANGIDCNDDARPDGLPAIFVVRPQAQPKPATANFPCDDMGTPV